jgi:hypothetical protein
VFRRIAEASLRYLGVAPTIDPVPPVMIARHVEPGPLPIATAAAAPQVSFVSEAPGGTMPDLRGLSARDAIRALVKVGLSARVTGDGVVVSQDPEPGASLEDVEISRLRLERTRAAAASQP